MKVKVVMEINRTNCYAIEIPGISSEEELDALSPESIQEFISELPREAFEEMLDYNEYITDYYAAWA